MVVDARQRGGVDIRLPGELGELARGLGMDWLHGLLVPENGASLTRR